MTTPTTNLTLSNIQNALGGVNPINLSEYYRNGSTGYVKTYQTKSSVDSEFISTSGLIRMGMFRGLGTITGTFTGADFSVSRPSSAGTISVNFNPDGTITFDGTQNVNVPRWFSDASGSSLYITVENYVNYGAANPFISGTPGADQMTTTKTVSLGSTAGTGSGFHIGWYASSSGNSFYGAFTLGLFQT